jgi:predicted molibdopterin-dependent oxidoreductase YjgC
MMTAAREGSLKALVVAGDNPLLYAPDKAAVRAALSNLDFLLVIDSLPTDTARMADIVLASMPTYAREGTSTSADRRLLKLRPAIDDTGDVRQGWQILADLSRRLAARLGISAAEEYAVVENVTTAIASSVPAYRSLIAEFVSGQSRALSSQQASRAAIQAVERETTTESAGDFILTTGRSLYTSLEGASIHSPEADKLHREEYVEVNPVDAARLGVEDVREAVLANERGELAIRARVTDAVLPGVLFVPLHYDGGAVTALFPPEDDGWVQPRVRLAVRVKAI